MENEIVWQATLTKDMVAHLDEESLGELIDQLNNVVATICECEGVGD